MIKPTTTGDAIPQDYSRQQQHQYEQPAEILAVNDSPTTNGTYVQQQINQDCTNFTDLKLIADATMLNISAYVNVTAMGVALPRPFMFLGYDPINKIVVTQDGAINIRGDMLTSTYRPVPISLESDNNNNNNNDDDPYEHVPRISVAQSGGVVQGYPGSTDGIYILETDSSIIISWESISLVSGRFLLTCQVELFYDTGDIEMRWSPSGDFVEFAAGIEDETLGVAYPARGGTFIGGGISNSFLSEFQCLNFKAQTDTEKVRNQLDLLACLLVVCVYIALIKPNLCVFFMFGARYRRTS
jgi:hypothetical protein